ncbi:hypothetical protein QQ045_022845 [Rhodiola kirilowii]
MSISERPISVTSAKNNISISPGETPKNWLDERLLEDVSEQTTSIYDFFEQHVERSHINNPKWEAQAFFKHVKADLEANVSRMKCFRARQNALKIIDGSVSEQFKPLTQYCGALLKWCPGSTILLKTDGPHFQRIYICLDACKRGFLTGCRSIISLYSCHLKGHYKGQIHSAVGRDANENIFPIAWAVCEAESKETWTWFLHNLINDIGIHVQHSWCFISDQQKEDQEKRTREVDELVTPHRVRRGDIKMKCSNCGKVGHNRTRCKDEPSNPKKAADGAKDAARKKVSRQLKKARLEGRQQVKSNPSPPKKLKVSNQVSLVSEWTMRYETSTSVVTYRPPHHEGPIYINGGVFTMPKTSIIQDQAGSNIFQGSQGDNRRILHE